MRWKIIFAKTVKNAFSPKVEAGLEVASRPGARPTAVRLTITGWLQRAPVSRFVIMTPRCFWHTLHLRTLRDAITHLAHLSPKRSNEYATGPVLMNLRVCGCFASPGDTSGYSSRDNLSTSYYHYQINYCPQIVLPVGFSWSQNIPYNSQTNSFFFACPKTGLMVPL